MSCDYFWTTFQRIYDFAVAPVFSYMANKKVNISERVKAHGKWTSMQRSVKLSPSRSAPISPSLHLM